MKKYLKEFVVSVIAIFVFMPFINVNAADLDQTNFDDALANPGTNVNGVVYSSDAADYYLVEGTHKLVENINLDGHALFLPSGTITLNLNGKSITTAEDTYSPMVVAEGSSAQLTITGNGSINGNKSLGAYNGATITVENGAFNEVEIEDATLIIKNGTFATDDFSLISARGESNITIKNGNFKGTIFVNDKSNITIDDGSFIASSAGTINFGSSGTATINNGTFTGTDGISAMYIINSKGKVTINGGVFTSDEDCGIEQGAASETTLIITGGTFTGKETGLGTDGGIIKLSGGTFKATSDDKGGLRMSNGTVEAMNAWLEEGYEYSPVLTITNGEYANYSQKEIKVVSQNSANDNDSDEYVDYNIIGNDGNLISLKNDEGKVYTFESIDLTSLTDSDLQEIIENYDLDVTLEALKIELSAIIENAKVAVSDKGSLLKVFEFNLYEAGTEVHTAPDGFKIKIKITDDMKGYDTYKLFYINNDGTTETAIILTKNGDYLVGTLPHLSTYALVGSNTTNDTTSTTASTMSNPNTADPFDLYLKMLVLSLIGFVSTLIYMNKSKLELVKINK